MTTRQIGDLMGEFNFLTVAGWLSVLRREVDAFANATAAMRHNAKPTLQYCSDNSDVGAMPQQLPVLDVLVDSKTVALKRNINLYMRWTSESQLSKYINTRHHKPTQHSIVVHPTAARAISTTSFTRRSFSAAAPLTWNSLPPAMLNCDSLSLYFQIQT